MKPCDVKINKGSILIYRVFDLGEEVSLNEVTKLLSKQVEGVSRLSLTKDPRKSIIIREAPLLIQLGESKVSLGNTDYVSSMTAKIWDYGSLSISFQIQLPQNLTWDQLVQLAAQIENSTQIDQSALEKAKQIHHMVSPAIKNTLLWDVSEDYVIYFIEKIEGVEKNNAAAILDTVNYANLIHAESSESISDMSKKALLDNLKQYSSDDFAIIDWNSALIYEPQGQKDIVDVIEFSLTHLLEMRFYDDLLTKNLSKLYTAIENKKAGRQITNNLYSDLSADTSSRYIEFTEFLERIDNSLKTVGDFYLATIFRTASVRFRFDDWNRSIDRKMQSLAKISELLQGEVNSRRTHNTEIIIIALIVVETIIGIVQMVYR
jgi:hypothetical protein